MHQLVSVYDVAMVDAHIKHGQNSKQWQPEERAVLFQTPDAHINAVLHCYVAHFKGAEMDQLAGSADITLPVPSTGYNSKDNPVYHTNISQVFHLAEQ